MKRIIALITLFAVCTALFGCAKEDDSTENTAESAMESTAAPTEEATKPTEETTEPTESTAAPNEKVIKYDHGEKVIKFKGTTDEAGEPLEGTLYLQDDLTGALTREKDTFIVAYSDGGAYRGQMKRGLRHGKGTMIFANGDKYEGAFVNDVFSGECTEESKNVYTWANGDVYTGDFLDGKKHGQGKLTFADGDEDPDNDPYYEGGFEDDLRQGKGVERYADGSVYEGDFENGKLHGEGVYNFANGDYYTGNFAEGIRRGKGTYVWENGDVYSGDFEDGKMHGEGTYTLSNGTVYSGLFENGELVVGEGTIIDVTPNQ